MRSGTLYCLIWAALMGQTHIFLMLFIYQDNGVRCFVNPYVVIFLHVWNTGLRNKTFQPVYKDLQIKKKRNICRS